MRRKTIDVDVLRQNLWTCSRDVVLFESLVATQSLCQTALPNLGIAQQH
jgi:hypothetical protein